MSKPSQLELDAAERALVEVGLQLRALGYRFTTVTPETHRRNNARPSAQKARSLRDVFGWRAADRAPVDCRSRHARNGIVLADINPAALKLARVNAHLAGVADRVELACGDLFAPVEGEVDLVIANPPYLLDAGHRMYRDGGGELGEGLAVRIVREGLARLASAGQLVLYSGAPIIDGRDRVREALAPLLDAGAAR